MSGVTLTGDPLELVPVEHLGLDLLFEEPDHRVPPSGPQEAPEVLEQLLVPGGNRVDVGVPDRAEGLLRVVEEPDEQEAVHHEEGHAVAAFQELFSEVASRDGREETDRQ